MQTILQSEATAARRRILVYLVDDTDGVTPKTGITVSAGNVKISKAGAAEANGLGTLVEIATGTYYYEFTAGEVDTFGFIQFKFTQAATRTFVKETQVVAVDPYNPASTLTAANVWDYLTASIATANSIGKLIKDNLDAAISSRSTYAGADTSGTTTLLSRIASALTITGGKVDVNDAGAISTDITAIKTKTDQLTFTTPNKVDAVAAAITDKTGYSLSSAGIDAILDDAPSAELAAMPGATGTLRQMVQYIFQYLRNKRTVSITTETLYKENGTTVLGTATVSDNGTTTTKGKMG